MATISDRHCKRSHRVAWHRTRLHPIARWRLLTASAGLFSAKNSDRWDSLDKESQMNIEPAIYWITERESIRRRREAGAPQAVDGRSHSP